MGILYKWPRISLTETLVLEGSRITHFKYHFLASPLVNPRLSFLFGKSFGFLVQTAYKIINPNKKFTLKYTTVQGRNHTTERSF